MTNIKILSQQKVFKAELFDVLEVKLLEDEKTRIHHNVERRPTISVLPLTDAFEIYLVSQYRYIWKKVQLEAVAGFVEKRESPLNAAKRELKEETGIEANHWEELSRVEINASVVKSLVYIFIAKDLKQTGEEIEKGIEFIKIPLEDAVKKVMTGEINTSASMIGILLLDKLRKEKKL
ncbi:MAG: NUDIX hydrolase [Candidatus Levybacteria bacterium]|nr:NUDIX hydrolase [Candidatus Levybacteria bacterium]